MSKKIPFTDSHSFSSYEEYREELKKIKNIRRAIDNNHPLRVTNHAVDRYIVRSGDLGKIRGDIRDIIRKKISECTDMAQMLNGVTKAWIDGESYFVIKDNKVLTFVSITEEYQLL